MCNKCDEGLVTYTDWVPYGSTNVPMETTEFCDCVFDSCPKCGNITVETVAGDDYTVACDNTDCDWSLTL